MFGSRPSRWALAHILVIQRLHTFFLFLSRCLCFFNIFYFEGNVFHLWRDRLGIDDIITGAGIRAKITERRIPLLDRCHDIDTLTHKMIPIPRFTSWSKYAVYYC